MIDHFGLGDAALSVSVCCYPRTVSTLVIDQVKNPLGPGFWTFGYRR